MNGIEPYERKSKPVKAAVTMYGEKVFENHLSSKKPSQLYSEPSTITREPKYGRNYTAQSNGRRSDKESAKGQAESELQNAKITLRDLTSKIEQSSLRAKSQIEYMEKLKKKSTTAEEEGEKSTDTHQYLQLMRELKDVKQELRKLKEEMASLLEEKIRAEKEAETSKLKLRTLASSVNPLREEIEETNEEQVLVELARIEAFKEYEAIESQRIKDAEKHSAVLDKTKKKISDTKQEVEAAKELEKKLAITTSDVHMLESELKQVKEMDNEIPGIAATEQRSSHDADAANAPYLLKSITKEIEEAKNELASVKEEGFKFMASMDIIRTELKNVSEEAARAKKREVKTDLTVQNLNAKLLRGKAKLEAAILAEEKANDIVSNLSRALDQLKTEAEAAKKEKFLIDEETANVVAEVEKTESEIELAEERLEAAIEELKAVKSSEGKALGKLKTLIENTVKRRVSVSQRSSVITISSFESEYLRGRALGAEDIADKKVAAAQAWIEAIKASEREILMKTEMAKKEMRELKIEEDQGANQPRQSFHSKRKVEIEVEKWRQKYDEIMESEKPRTPSGLPGRSTNRSGRHTKLRRPASPGPRSTPRSSSFIVRRRRKSMPTIAKLFSGKNTNKSTEAR